jgi:glycosyltransferase involved in cell wall biosynthesis
MGTISVITPIYNPIAEHLLSAYESLRTQKLPYNWSWEWVVQEDGHTDNARTILPDDDSRISFSSNRHLGVAMTRNLALSRSQGSLIKNLDQDDVLTDGVLQRDISILNSRSDVEWTTSRVLDLMPDGSTVGFEGDPCAGTIATGSVHEYWRTHDYRASVHPTTICIRRSLVEALGGWMAVPGSDDTGLLIAASVTATGYFHPEVGLLYRKWPGQVTAGSEHTEPVERQLRMQLIDARAKSLLSRRCIPAVDSVA